MKRKAENVEVSQELMPRTKPMSIDEITAALVDLNNGRCLKTGLPFWEMTFVNLEHDCDRSQMQQCEEIFTIWKKALVSGVLTNATDLINDLRKQIIDLQLYADNLLMPEKEIVFYENDGTERRLIYDEGDPSVGIGSGYVPDDDCWIDRNEMVALKDVGPSLEELNNRMTALHTAACVPCKHLGSGICQTCLFGFLQQAFEELHSLLMKWKKESV